MRVSRNLSVFISATTHQDGVGVSLRLVMRDKCMRRRQMKMKAKQPKKNQIQRTFVNVAIAEHCLAYPAIDRIIEENRAKHINCASKVTLMRKMKR